MEVTHPLLTFFSVNNNSLLIAIAYVNTKITSIVLVLNKSISWLILFRPGTLCSTADQNNKELPPDTRQNQHFNKCFNHQYNEMYQGHQPMKICDVTNKDHLSECFFHEAVINLLDCITQDTVIKSYNSVTKLHSTKGPLKKVCAGTALRSLVNAALEEVNKARSVNKQFAFAIIFWKSGRGVRSSTICPCRQSTFSHSEEILIQKIDPFLKKFGSMVGTVFIYSNNSPCLNRCMPKLKAKAEEWNAEYGIHTDVAFRNCWGVNGPADPAFHGLTYSDLMSHFVPHIEKCEKTPFKLDNKNFKKLRSNNIISSSGVVISELKKEQRESIYKHIYSALDDLRKLSESPDPFTGSEYLEKMSTFQLPTIINSEITVKVSETLKEKWNEMVHQSYTTLIKDKITAEFNTLVVDLYAHSLNPNGPFQLHHLQEDQ
ncbi:uncharacterized protein V6R79_022208 [Siganus canaliculatus]